MDHVCTITSISGGAIPAIVYALAKAHNVDEKTCFSDLYKSIVENNLAEQMLEHFYKTKDTERSFIKSLAHVYNEVFFKNATFGAIIDMMKEEGLHHFSVDSTDFELGLPFRFQATMPLNIQNREEPFGVIGNKIHKIDRDKAKDIRIADIMAATSCFPLAFEPIVFPKDFQFSDPAMNTLENGAEYFLMDGGLLDNQGIDPMHHAEWHLSSIGRHHDLVILSDAGNKPIKKENKDIKWSCHSLGFWSIIGFVVSLCLLISSIYFHKTDSPFVSGLTLMGGISLLLVLIISNCLVFKIKEYICKELKIKGNFKILWRSSINDIATFLKARATTIYRMVDFVMMGHIKKVAYNGLKNREFIRGKVQMNSLTVLSKGGKWNKILNKRNQADKSLVPSRIMRQNTKKANMMNTTLWFTPEEINKGIPQALLACGQYTTCWNLLQHIDKIKVLSPEELSEGQKMIIRLEPILKGDWDRFNKKPQQLAKTYNI